MPRNLYQRVEVLFPLKDKELRERVCHEILPAYLADNQKARVLGSNGQYSAARPVKGSKRISVLEQLMKLAGGFVNGSGTARQPYPIIAYTKTEPGTVPVEPAPTLELETQDSTNATV
jgi:hypothetical protein